MNNNSKDHNTKGKNVFIILGRILGTLASIFWGASLLLHAFSGEKDLSLEGFLLTILIVLNITGVVIAFQNEKRGSLTIIISSLFLCIFSYISAGRNEAFAIAISGLPFLVSGTSFLLGWLKSNQDRYNDNH